VAGALDWFGETAAEAREYAEQSEAEQSDAGPRPDRYLLQLWRLGSPGPVVTLRDRRPKETRTRDSALGDLKSVRGRSIE
jgi:hypothetical protein